jgi:hypothetical protein
VNFRCSGGVRFTSGSAGGNQTVSWTPGNAAWSFSSDRTLKENITAVDPAGVLDTLSRLPLQQWNYIGYQQRHLGPMAQDFHAAFPWSGDDTTLNSADLHGVALAAIQGLSQKLEQREMELTELRQRFLQKDVKIAKLEQRLSALEQLIGTQTPNGKDTH